MHGDDEWFDDFEEDSSQGNDATSQHSDDDSREGSYSDYNQSSDDDDVGDAPLQGEQGTNVSRSRPPFTILTRETLRQMQGKALEQVQSILGCTTTTARALLTYFSWDAERVLSTIAERGEEGIYKRAGILPQTDDAAESAAIVVHGDAGSGEVTCGVCFCDIPCSEAVAMSCRHPFCSDCWRQHVSLGITEGMGRRLKCMAPGCGVLCDEPKVRKLLSDDSNSNTSASPELLEKYEAALVDGFVEDNKRVKWCPSIPHCGRAACVNGDTHCEVTCACGLQFCFACGDAPHSPATCEMLKEWQRRLQSGTETESWIRANTKDCPKCSKPVEKNGGCNLVLCRCGQAFCWLCGQATGRAHDWNSIHGHSCGAYLEEAETRQSEAQRSLKRYLHYLTRYEAHLASLCLETRARNDLEKRIDAAIENEAQFGGLSNFGWLQNALEQLFLARRAMAHSYVFAFYVFGPDFAVEFPPKVAETNKALFEDKQGQLEAEVERLAELVDNTSAELIPHQRLAIINLASSINARILKLYDVIENEIAPQVAGRPMNVAPYRGQASVAVIGSGSGGGGGGAGPSLMPNGDGGAAGGSRSGATAANVSAGSGGGGGKSAVKRPRQI